MRYDYLLERVREKQPRVILEVGTWNGARAEAMLLAAPGAKYYGFDVFEGASDELHKAEYNAKGFHGIAAVEKRLARFDAKLVKGNTRDTLPAFTGELVDFAWIDGGHSVETIRSDWRAVARLLAHDAEVWFDDYYTGGPDIGFVGCNLIVRDYKHEVYPVRDPLNPTGFVQMVRVYP